MDFNYENKTVVTTENELLYWLQMLHGVLVDCGAWDRLVAYDTETAQQLEILAIKAETL